MTYLPFWAGGITLAVIVFLHYATLRSQLAVSGRISSLVNRARAKLAPTPEPELSDAELIAAMRAMTAAEFGDAAVDAPVPVDTERRSTTTSSVSHLLFLLGLAGGGFLVARASDAFVTTPTLAGEVFARTFDSGALAYGALFGGGLLVGIGTRMSGGCTSGHGLVGVPRLERGSLLATAAFFGTGIAVSLLIEVLR